MVWMEHLLCRIQKYRWEKHFLVSCNGFIYDEVVDGECQEE